MESIRVATWNIHKGVNGIGPRGRLEIHNIGLAIDQFDADIICCATSSLAPLIHGKWLRPGTHLDLIGGFTPAMRETDDEAVRRSMLFVDSRWFTTDHVGDLTQPLARGVIQRAHVLADLFELCVGSHAGRTDAAQITLCKYGGGAHLDLMAAQYIASHTG